VVEPPLRQRFDQWYSSHHLPMALSEFKAEKCWRFWSALDAGVHYAAYQFADLARLDAALNSDGYKICWSPLSTRPGRTACPARATGLRWWRSWDGELRATPSPERGGSTRNHGGVGVVRVTVLAKYF
jgi:hypothetical protein